ncbi:hypothetical protein [Sphingobium herbicidovorans]|nr:hypothetical protein [Sphingobium herbicidovorans]
MAPAFVPAIIEEPPSVEPASAKRLRKQARAKDGAVELEIDGVAVKIGRGANAGIIVAIIEAPRATR